MKVWHGSWLALALALTACGKAKDAEPDSAEAPSSAQPASDTAAKVSPSFDCAKAASEAEEMVCKNPDLAAMDVELTRIYGLAAATPQIDPARLAELKATQRGWVKGRDECWKADDKAQCVMTSYAMRIHELRQGYANARSADAAGKSTGPLALACDGTDFGVAATFVQTDPGAVYLEWKDSSMALAHVPSGSGAKYEGTWDGKKAGLFTQGDEAMLTLPGEAERRCKVEEIG